jgi:hypothetical protein
MANVRYIVNDVDAAVDFDTRYLRFAVRKIELFEMAPRK